MTVNELINGDHLPMPAAPQSMTEGEADAYHERIAIMLEARLLEVSAKAQARRRSSYVRRTVERAACIIAAT